MTMWYQLVGALTCSSSTLAANHQPATATTRRPDRGNLQGAPQASVKGITYDTVFRLAPIRSLVYFVCTPSIATFVLQNTVM